MAIGGRAAAMGPEFNVRDQIIAFKRKLAPRREALKPLVSDRLSSTRSDSTG